MAYTVDFVDMATYWVELVAQLGKDAKTTRESIKTIEKTTTIQTKRIASRFRG